MQTDMRLNPSNVSSSNFTAEPSGDSLKNIIQLLEKIIAALDKTGLGQADSKTGTSTISDEGKQAAHEGNEAAYGSPNAGKPGGCKEPENKGPTSQPEGAPSTDEAEKPDGAKKPPEAGNSPSPKPDTPTNSPRADQLSMRTVYELLSGIISLFQKFLAGNPGTAGNAVPETPTPDGPET